MLVKASEHWDESLSRAFEKSQMLVGIYQQTLFAAYVIVRDYNDTEVTRIYYRFPNRISFRLKESDYWIKETNMDEQTPTLFLHTVIFDEKGNTREFQRLKTVMIHSTGIDVWSDSYL